MSKRNPYWTLPSVLGEYQLVWGALDLTPYLYGLPQARRDTMSNWINFEFELYRFDEEFRIDLYLLFNQSIENRGTPLFYGGQGHSFEAFSYSQSQDAVPIIKGLLAESPVTTTIEGVLKHPLDRNRPRSGVTWDNAPRGDFYVPTLP